MSLGLSALSKMRRVHSLLAFALSGIVLIALFLSSSSDTGPYTAAFAFGSRWSDSASSPACPYPLFAPFERKEEGEVYRPICRSLATHPELTGALALSVQLCLSSRTINHGWVQIERTDAAACAASEAIVASHDPESNTLLRAKGPDFFHVDVDGEQRWGAEVDVQYLGRCAYRYPFRLVSGAPFNLSIWWTFQDYRAALETEELATQYDLARPVLADAYQMVYPLFSPNTSTSRRGSGMCPPSVAIASDPAWRSPAQAAYLASLPECSEWEATEGVYLRTHQTEPYGSIFQGFVFQPTGCRWSNPLRYGAPRLKSLHPRNILFLGDSHTRYAYDLLVYAYHADWTNFTLAPPMKGLIKSERIGPLKLDFVWESVLLEDRITLNCSVVQKYDTIVIGGGQHNAFKIPAEADHARQWPLRDWSALTASIARRLSPEACPNAKRAKVVWIGAPARISRKVAAPRNAWLDAASSFRTRLYDSTAAAHFVAIGGARVDMFALSEPFVNDFGDTLHMRGTDAMTALIQEVHQKIAPHKAAYEYT